MCSLLHMSVQPPSSQVAVISGGDDDRELSKLKVRDRSGVLQKSAKRSGRQSQARIFPGFSVDDKEVGTTCTDVGFFHTCVIWPRCRRSISPPLLRLSVGLSVTRMNKLPVWIRREWWLCSRNLENILLNTGKNEFLHRNIYYCYWK